MRIIYTPQALEDFARMVVGKDFKDDRDVTIGTIKSTFVREGMVYAIVIPLDGDGTYSFTMMIL